MIQLPSTPGAMMPTVALALGGVLALAFARRRGAGIYGILRGRETDVFGLTTGTVGPVKLSGRAEAVEGTFEAPFTGTPCLAIRYEVQERRQTRNGSTWVEIDGGVGAKPFLLDDGRESVLVEPDRARLALEKSDVIEVDGGDAPPAQIQSFIDRADDVDSEEKSWNLFGLEVDVGDDRRYVEHRLEPTESVTVFGEVEPRQGVSTRSGQVNAVVTSGSMPLVVSETTPYRTVLQVFWPILLVALLGVALLAAALLLLIG